MKTLMTRITTTKPTHPLFDGLGAQGLPDTSELTPLISMWQPWAQWVELGWKRFETRTHKRFASLLGRRIGIHISQHWDKNWERDAGLFLSATQIGRTRSFPKEQRGVVRFTVKVDLIRDLDGIDSDAALIDCNTVKRFGLRLVEHERLSAPIYMPGRQGIWYANLKS